MSNAEPEEVTLLREIRGILADLLALSKSKRAATAQPVDDVATDAELDHPTHGDPIMKWKPRDWSGEDCRNKRMSECEPELLDLFAKAYDEFGRQKEEVKDPKAKYERMTARRARGWARRLRAGWKPPAPEATEEIGTW